MGAQAIFRLIDNSGTWRRFMALALVFFICANVHAENLLLAGTVVAVTDGDTIKVLDQNHVLHRIRLAGIDAPEKRQAFGTRAKESLAELCFDKTARVEYSKLDRYGRVVGKVLINGRDVNLEQIKRGLAWHYKQYEMEQSSEDRVAYAIAEVRARNGKVGLWTDHNAVPPWIWRRM